MGKDVAVRAVRAAGRGVCTLPFISSVLMMSTTFSSFFRTSGLIVEATTIAADLARGADALWGDGRTGRAPAARARAEIRAADDIVDYSMLKSISLIETFLRGYGIALRRYLSVLSLRAACRRIATVLSVMVHVPSRVPTTQQYSSVR